MKRQFNCMLLMIMLIIVSGLSACATAPEVTTPAAVTNPGQLVVTQVEPVAATSVPTITPAPTPDEESLRSKVISALMALSSTQNRMDSLTEIEGGKVNHSIIEFIPKDKKRIVSVEDEVEYIIIGEKVYMKAGASGAWEVAQIPASLFMGQAEVSEQSVGEMISQLQYVGQDQLDGKPMLVIQYIETSKTNDGELESQVELWIGEADGLPYQLIKNGKIYTVVSDPATGENKQVYVEAKTTTTINFEPSFEIIAPIQD